MDTQDLVGLDLIEQESFAETLAVLASEERFDTLYDLLVEAAPQQPRATAGASLALRAAEIARESLNEAGRSEEAANLAIRLDPCTAEAWEMLAELYRGLEDWQALSVALEQLGFLSEEATLRAEYFAQAADALERSGGDPTAALGLTLRALRALPTWQGPGLALALLIGAPARSARMEARLRRALEGVSCGPREAELLLNLGRLLVSDIGRREEAVQLLMQAAAFSDAAALSALGLLGSLHSLKEGWKDLFEQLLVEAEDQLEDSAGSAALLRQAAQSALTPPVDRARAKRALKLLLGRIPEDEDGAEAMLRLLEEEGRPKEAILLLEDLARVVESPVAARYLVRAGLLSLSRFGDRAASLRSFEAALRRHPQGRDAATHLKEAYRDMGRWRALAEVILLEVEGRALTEGEVLEAWHEAGRVLWKKAGDISAALPIYRRIIAHSATDEQAQTFFEAYHSREDKDGPLIDVQVAWAKEQTGGEARAKALAEAAEAAVRLGSPARARAYFEAARQETPEDGQLRDRYFEVLRGWGEAEALVDVVEAERSRIGETDPAWPALTLFLAEQVYRGLGMLERGLNLYRELAGHEGEEAEAARVHAAALENALQEAATPSPREENELPEIELGDTLFSATPAESEDSEALEEAAAGPTLTPAQALARARERQGAGLGEESLALAEMAIEGATPGDPVAIEARELAADLLLGELHDAPEGLDRLAALGRDRSLELGTRRRINEARVRILERDIEAGGARDRALADALADAAAVAKTPEVGRGFTYRRARLLGARADAWRVGADLLRTLLLDDPDAPLLLQALSEIFEREEQWAALAKLLARQASLAKDDGEAAEIYARLADIAADGQADSEAAIGWLSEAIARCPDHRPSLVALARLSKETGHSAERVKALQGWIAIEEDHQALPGLHYALGEAHEKLGETEQAMNLYRRTLESSPESPAALGGMLRCAHKIGDAASRAEAIEETAHFCRNGEEAARLHAERARIYLQLLGDPESARAAVREALEADDGSLEALTVARQLAERDQQGPGVVASLLRRELWASESAEDAAERYAELGALHAGPLNDPSAAESYYRRALSTEADHPRAMAGLARLLIATERKDEAAVFLRGLSHREGTPPTVRSWAAFELGVAQEADSEFRDALESYKRAGTLDPEVPDPPIAIARLGAKLGDDADVAGALERVVELGLREVAGAPRGAELTETMAKLGGVQRRLGRRRAAIRAYRQALDRDAVHVEALRALSVLYEMDHELLAAAEMRERAAELVSDRHLRSAALAAVGGFYRDRVGDPRQALTVFQRACALDPEVLAYHAAELALSRKLGRTGEARAAALCCVGLAERGSAAAEYLCIAAECAEAEGALDEALGLARAALERDPCSKPALARVMEAAQGPEAERELDELLERALAASNDPTEQVKGLLDLARRREDRGDRIGAAEAIARAVVLDPTDLALHNSLAQGAPPPLAIARAAEQALEQVVANSPVQVATVLALEALATAQGDQDGAYLAGAVLEILGAAPPELMERTRRASEHLPSGPGGVLEADTRDELCPPGWPSREMFYSAAERVILAPPPGERLLRWAPVEYKPADASWQAEADRVAATLGLPARALGLGADGVGIRVLPDPAVVVLGGDLLNGRSAAEVRFSLAFALAMAVPGRRWASATRDPLPTLELILRWASGTAADEELPVLLERFGEAARGDLEMALGTPSPTPRSDLGRTVLVGATLAFVVAGDLKAGFKAALRLLAPGVPAPKDLPALLALSRDRPVLGSLLGVVHSGAFRSARRQLRLSVPD